MDEDLRLIVDTHSRLVRVRLHPAEVDGKPMVSIGVLDVGAGSAA